MATEPQPLADLWESSELLDQVPCASPGKQLTPEEIGALKSGTVVMLRTRDFNYVCLQVIDMRARAPASTAAVRWAQGVRHALLQTPDGKRWFVRSEDLTNYKLYRAVSGVDDGHKHVFDASTLWWQEWTSTVPSGVPYTAELVSDKNFDQIRRGAIIYVKVPSWLRFGHGIWYRFEVLARRASKEKYRGKDFYDRLVLRGQSGKLYEATAADLIDVEARVSFAPPVPRVY